EEGIKLGGAGESIRDEIEKITGRFEFTSIAVENDMIKAASQKRQRELALIDSASICELILSK
ncbi:MAG: hypothetical protein J6Z43_09900, partial [Clostridiales bacterium]|nr:hypothetical protein [Clostridiales bacterium]